jgi:hypothetical protein
VGAFFVVERKVEYRSRESALRAEKQLAKHFLLEIVLEKVEVVNPEEKETRKRFSLLAVEIVSQIAGEQQTLHEVPVLQVRAERVFQLLHRKVKLQAMVLRLLGKFVIFHVFQVANKIIEKTLIDFVVLNIKKLLKKLVALFFGQRLQLTARKKSEVVILVQNFDDGLQRRANFQKRTLFFKLKTYFLHGFVVHIYF